MSGEITRAGSLPLCIVSFQVLEGSNDPYGITSGILLSENFSRIYRIYLWPEYLCAFVCVGMHLYNSLSIHCLIKVTGSYAAYV